MAAGIFSKAALSGAKTVNGPGPDRVSARPAACTALTRVVRFEALAALATMVSFGLMAAPPTIGSVEAGAMAELGRGGVGRRRLLARLVAGGQGQQGGGGYGGEGGDAGRFMGVSPERAALTAASQAKYGSEPRKDARRHHKFRRDT